MLCFPTSPNECFCTTWQNDTTLTQTACTRSQKVAPFDNRSVDNILFKVKPSLQEMFCGHQYHKSLFRTCIAA